VLITCAYVCIASDNCCTERQGIQTALGDDVKVVQDEWHLKERPLRALTGDDRRWRPILRNYIKAVIKRDPNTRRFPEGEILEKKFAAMLATMKTTHPELFKNKSVQNALLNLGSHLRCLQVRVGVTLLMLWGKGAFYAATPQSNLKTKLIFV